MMPRFGFACPRPHAAGAHVGQVPVVATGVILFGPAQRRQPVDAGRIVLPLVVAQGLGALPAGPGGQLRPLRRNSNSGTPKPQLSAIRSTRILMIARVPGAASPNAGCSKVKAASWGSMTSPVPYRRTMFGAPSKAQNITVIRPLSRRCAMVSAPLPTESRYATSRGPSTRSASRPLGDRLTCPPGPDGAVATKNIGWRSMKARKSRVISLCSFPIGSRYSRGLGAGNWGLGLGLGASAPAPASPSPEARHAIRLAKRTPWSS